MHLRQKGQMLGVISTKTFEAKELLAKINEYRKKTQESLLPKISVDKPRQIGKGKTKIAILDLGITHSIIKQLEALGLAITIFPYNTLAHEIIRIKPKGLIISSGPEEDPGLKEVVQNIKSLIGKLPILGISTGHQVIARALGAKVNKMKLGHHGVNYPIQNPASYKGEITVQNHSYSLDAESLGRIKDIKITGYNLNDRTIEEIESKKLKLMGIQYSPVSPGFNEVSNIFKRFVKLLGRSH